MNIAWDLIGDIHGHADNLERLLAKLGYAIEDGVFRHPDRRVLFLGDFIDGGTQNRRVLDIVKPMVEAGAALAIMGNHEYNAICYHTRDDSGEYLRAHTDKNLGPHELTIAEFEGLDDPALKQMIDWFKTLPLFIERDGLRAVHACWDDTSIWELRDALGGEPVMSDAFIVESCDKNSDAHKSVEIVLKGREFELPDGITFHDKYNHTRSEARIRWWLNTADTLDQLVLGPPDLYANTNGHPVDANLLIGYGRSQPPVFFGHYWLTGEPVLQQSNVACLDYSVARDGKLVAYRWDGERTLIKTKFSW